ncbi:hypothetical protein EGW08_014338 [Elysia chlorotica]|uniref:Uncharacterized protein n=1 Tax=Elysia chlorotica TaxID=188477 RepID=A0A433T8H9_ELYCH|nr:hypothetical protein EGW08_014338 [Elysia chlorotica]
MLEKFLFTFLRTILSICSETCPCQDKTRTVEGFHPCELTEDEKLFVYFSDGLNTLSEAEIKRIVPMIFRDYATQRDGVGIRHDPDPVLGKWMEAVKLEVETKLIGWFSISDATIYNLLRETQVEERNIFLNQILTLILKKILGEENNVWLIIYEADPQYFWPNSSASHLMICYPDMSGKPHRMPKKAFMVLSGSKCTKTQYHFKDKVELAVISAAAAAYNFGPLSVSLLGDALNVPSGAHSARLANSCARKRLNKSPLKNLDTEKRRRQSIEYSSEEYGTGRVHSADVNDTSGPKNYQIQLGCIPCLQLRHVGIRKGNDNLRTVE